MKNFLTILFVGVSLLAWERPLQAQKALLFNAPIIIPLPVTCTGQATAVKIADFNNDGFQDVLIVTSASNPAGCQLLIYYQNTVVPGTFNSPEIIDYPSQGPGASAVDVADLDNDNLPDVVLGLGDNICVLHNNSGVLIPGDLLGAGSVVSSLKIGDVTDDGLPDIVVSTKNDDCLGVFINQGNLQFVPVGLPSLHSAANNQLIIADLNNDGLPDVVLMRGQAATQTIAIYYQNNQGGLALPVYLDLGEAADVLAVGSLDNNPGNDIACTSELGQGAGEFSMWSSSNLSGSPSLTSICSPNTAAMVTADLNQDGVTEIVAAHNKLNMISILWCNDTFLIGASSFSYTNFSTQSPHDCLAAGDLNHDNSPDLALADSSLGLIIMFNEVVSGLNDLRGSQALAVYPNPFREQLIIKVREASALNLINIYSALGQPVATYQSDKTIIQIDSRSFQPGFYTVELLNHNGKREVVKALKL